jgi:type I restriction enzyme S subunit
MSKLEELIQQYCPDGVACKRLKDVCSDFIVPMRDRPKVFDGDIPWCRIEDKQGQFFNGSLSGLGVSENVIKQMNLKVFPTGTVICSCSASLGTYAINTRPLITNQTFIGIVCGESLFNKYLLYFMETQTSKLISLSNSGTIPYVSRKKFEELEIPVPPLPVQEEIVRILDTLTELQAELQAELQKRLQQYNYYRDNLLSFEGRSDVEWKKLGDVCELGTGSHNTQDGLTEGQYPFYTRGSEVLYLNDYDYDETAIITAGDGAGVGKVFHFVKGKYALHQRAYRIVPNEKEVLPRFVYYYIGATFYDYIMRNSVSSSVVSIRRPMMVNCPIPVPPLSEQQRIVDILDRFYTLTTDITAGLPAEIEARRKQYEYYRDQLLTFKHKA